MAQTPSGSLFLIASAFGADKTITAVSNATEAVVTATHDFVTGDVVEITSGWGRLSRRIFRIKTVVATTSFVLEGMDTTSTSIYPVLGGVGTVRKVATWAQITTVMSPAATGGDAKNVTYRFIEDDSERNLNDGFSSIAYSMDLDADSIGTAGYTALKTLTDYQTNTALKIQMRSGSLIFIPCTAALNESVIFSEGSLNKIRATFSGLAKISRYAI